MYTILLDILCKTGYIFLYVIFISKLPFFTDVFILGTFCLKMMDTLAFYTLGQLMFSMVFP